MSKVWEILPDF